MGKECLSLPSERGHGHGDALERAVPPLPSRERVGVRVASRQKITHPAPLHAPMEMPFALNEPCPLSLSGRGLG